VSLYQGKAFPLTEASLVGMYPELQGKLHSHGHKLYFLCFLKGAEAALQLRFSAMSVHLAKDAGRGLDVISVPATYHWFCLW